ncbi:hypothetical protein KPH14_006759 [Odynerus spinipes]|uniref:MORN repeat-containing protein 5 n=1 Tax=Odynerus spinipes TaxID=1348599 RepID=A0AAD9VRJ0_9HYME|nr:hypothetical protein KPH14_006759 [Odynerus spinipes]
MDPDHRELSLEILGQVLQLVEEQTSDVPESVLRTQNDGDAITEISILGENVEQVQEDNCFHEDSRSRSNQNEENELEIKRNSYSLFLGENIFINGSAYSGTWNAVSMAGFGKFVFPHGTTFEGEFRDDKFHGHGTMSWPRGQSIDGVWINGRLKEKRYRFKDGLEFAEVDWKYCRFPDRRFYACITDGLRPARQTFETNCHPAKIIPSLCYDVGNGIYNPDTYCIMSYDSKKIMEIPTKAKARWIRNNCRKGHNTPTGYQPWLNENWSEEMDQNLDIPYCLPLSNDSPQKWWKRLSTFKQDTSIYRKHDYTCRNCYLRRERQKSCFGTRYPENAGECSSWN